MSLINLAQTLKEKILNNHLRTFKLKKWEIPEVFIELLFEDFKCTVTITVTIRIIMKIFIIFLFLMIDVICLDIFLVK